MDDIGAKTIEEFEIKDADRGEVTAVVSVMNVVDREGDVILPGAIRDGTAIKMSAYRHDIITEGKPPVGRGTLHVEGDRVVLRGKYFMSTQRAQEAFATVKELGGESEWSIGFRESLVKTTPMTAEWRAKGARRLIADIPIMEVSPVFLGANQYTRTVATKELSAEEEAAAAEAKVAADVAAKAEADARAAAEAEATAKLRDEIVAKVTAQMAEAKAQEEAAVAAKVAAAEKATADAESAQLAEVATKAAAESLALKTKAAVEFERFQRNMRRGAA